MSSQRTFRLDQERVDENYRISKAFDDLWICLSLSKQIINIYRYGERKSCSDKWDHLKFCLSLSKDDEATRQQRIYEREKAKWEKRINEPCLLDIWEEREVPPPPFKPFQADEKTTI
jgi:hypothetical protein